MTTANTAYDPLHDIADIAEDIALVLPTIEGLQMENSNDFWTFAFTDETLIELLEKLAPGSIDEAFLDAFHEHIGTLEDVKYAVVEDGAEIRMTELALLNLGVWINRKTR